MTNEFTTADLDLRDHNQRSGFDAKDHKIRDYEKELDWYIGRINRLKKALEDILEAPTSESHARAGIALDMITRPTET